MAMDPAGMGGDSSFLEQSEDWNFIFSLYGEDS